METKQITLGSTVRHNISRRLATVTDISTRPGKMLIYVTYDNGVTQDAVLASRFHRAG